MADATSVLNEISGALDSLASQALSQFSDERSFMEAWGWNIPGLNRDDLADYIRSPQKRIRRMKASPVSDQYLARLSQFPARIEYFRSNSLPHLPGGNNPVAMGALRGIIDSLNALLEQQSVPELDLEAISDNQLLPARQLHKLRAVKAGIERLEAASGDLEKKVAEINAARDIAESLPADLQSLEEARGQYDKARKEVEKHAARISEVLQDAETLRASLASSKTEAEAVLGRANKAYSAATTVGLGKAFAERADSLSKSIWVLGFFLVATLGIGAWITYSRVEFVHKLMMDPKISYNVLWLNLTFTAVSVSGPVWLAWLLTRQIGQRFRLAEDYGFKAAVAKAYEGYRAEAAHIDPELAKKLFAIALDRLDEAPLRLVEKESPGSPMHEAKGPVDQVVEIAKSVRKPTRPKMDGGSATSAEAEA